MAFDWRRNLWRGTGYLLGPLVRLWLQRRAARGKEEPARLSERLGIPGLQRPEGRLVWCHAASVGEAQALLPLLQALRRRESGLTLLLTTGTVTSARLVQQRRAGMPEGDGILHQFVPVDLPGAVDRFLDHWRPDLAVWTESEFWPGMLNGLRHRGIPALLINARLSDRSCRRWQAAPGTARWLLGSFAAIYAQTHGDAERLRRLGARDVQEVGNLKLAAPPLPVDEAAVAEWQQRLQGRPRWLVASTHPGEEPLAVLAHRFLEPHFPGLLTIIVPRHPERGPALASELGAPDLNIALRSRGEMPDAKTDLYIADTLGELGLWCRLSPLVAMGGSLIPHGGHNPLEPARLGCAVIFGPHMFNFTEAGAGLIAAGGARQFGDSSGLAEAAAALLQQPDTCRLMGERGQHYASGHEKVVDILVTAILDRLPR